MIKKYQVGFTYDKKNDLSTCIQTLIKDKKIQEQLSRNVKKLYNSEYEFNKVYNEMVDHLEEISKNYKSKIK